MTKKPTEPTTQPTQKQFMVLHQTNSGGHFEPPASHLLIEADTEAEAVKLAGEHITFCGDSGLYADYDDCGCCPCCGHRWYKSFYDPTPAPTLTLWGYESAEPHKFMRTTRYALIRKDGSMLVGDTPEKFQQIVDYANVQIKRRGV